jgi:regulator of sirC expression with transglutaminase-like and TPR domain
MNEKNISAQIRLLDDPDEVIYRTISNNLIDMGDEIVPELEKVWENTLDEKIQERIEHIIKTIQFDSVKKGMESWVVEGAKDIAFGAYLLARYQYPDLSWQVISNQLNQLKNEIWLELNDNLTALEKIRVLNHIFFEKYRFSPNNANFYSPQNAYLNLLIETKKGNPVSLGILYMSVAQRLELPVYGVNLPKNFILCFIDQVSAFEAFGDSHINSVLFYINPFNRGAVFGRKEIDLFLSQQQIEPIDSFYSPCSNQNTLIRLIDNLIISYEKLGYPDKSADLNELKEILMK